MNGVFVSICVPAYKNVAYLKRLLDSIASQTYKDYEVVVTDDSPDDLVEKFISTYQGIMVLRYFKNATPSGTPENWNQAIRHARGTWIKLMHDDDWFASTDSLAQFVAAIDPAAPELIFSAYNNVFLETGQRKTVLPDNWRLSLLRQKPYTLVSKNIIGPPSVIFHRNDQSLFYDNQTKWVVDIDFYIRRLETEKLKVIRKPLVNVGMGSEQVTVDCINDRKVQFPENYHLLDKVGLTTLRNVWVYDAWWRLFRNLEVTSPKDIVEAGYTGLIPDVHMSMIRFQNRFPKSMLRAGVISKVLMLVHYFLHRSKIKG